MILFSLFNASVSFWNYINKIINKKLDFCLIVYLDNIFIYINKIDYIGCIFDILEKLIKHLFYANLKKYRFYQDKVQFFNYLVFL